MIQGEHSLRRRRNSGMVAAIMRRADLKGVVETDARSDGSRTSVTSFAPADAEKLALTLSDGLDGAARVELVLTVHWNR